MDYYFIFIAEKMLGGKLPAELRTKLIDIHNLAVKAGGELHTQEQIATIVYDWIQNDNSRIK